MNAARKPTKLDHESFKRTAPIYVSQHGSLKGDVGATSNEVSFADGTLLGLPAYNDSKIARYDRLKRALDVVISLCFLLTVAVWVFPVIALMIKLTSRGPVFFKQKRYGKGGVAFVCLKFRTMTHSPVNVFVQATKNDCRITRVGRFLRSTSLDELPQFINVLQGHMSVVGPRPHPIDLDDKFCSLVPNFATRYTLKPGITGLAQMLGHRGETRTLREMAHRVRLDLLYIQKASLLLDIKILFGTAYSILRGDPKAY